MTLRRRLAMRYALVAGLCLLLLAGLAYHEFVVEPRVRRQLGIPKPSGSTWGEYAEVVFHSMIPLVLGFGWWLMRRTLSPIDRLAADVQRVRLENLREPLPRTHNHDEVDRLTEAFNDMTVRLDGAVQRIREFTLHASHELKTPLTVMRGEVELVLSEPPDLAPAKRERMQALLDEVQRLTRIVDSLTLLAKADAGLVPLDRTALSLSELVQECFQDAVILGEPHQVQVRLDACETIEIIGNRDRLRQLLLNLADNAVKYNRAGGSVVLALRRQAAKAEFTITNTGEGLPSEMQTKVFERFARGPQAPKLQVEGCGLGLAICHWIVEAHRGTISLISTPGHATSVTVRLPLG